MAFEFFVSIEGSQQGKFHGESLRKGFEGKIPCLKFFYEVALPIDVDTGLSKATRQHRPVTVEKEWGAASPQIFRALTRNELLPSVVFEFWKSDKTGAEQVYHTIKLKNATVSSLKMSADEVESERDPHGRGEIEEISFTFETIQLENVAGDTRATDTWVQ
jgi:type VI secretion system secreted protein Hcp